MSELADDNKTIFSGDLDSEERAAVKSGEKRGERVAMAEDPERFGLARQRALNRKKQEEGYERAFGEGRQCPRCEGDGIWHSTMGFKKVIPIVKCPRCNGKGRIKERWQE